MEPIHLTPAPEDAGTRIDCFLASHLDGVTRSAAQKLLEGGAVQVNGKAVAKNYKLTGRKPCPSRCRKRRRPILSLRTFPWTWCMRTRM